MITTFGWTAWQKSENKNNGKNTSQAKSAEERVGAATWKGTLESLAIRGHAIFFGNASGPVPPVDPLLLSKYGSLTMTRPKLPDYIIGREALEQRAGTVLAAVANGDLNIDIHTRLPLSKASEAFRLLTSRATVGKVILLPGADLPVEE